MKTDVWLPAGSSHKNKKTHIKYHSPQQEHTFGFPYQVVPEAFAATFPFCQASCVRLDSQCNAQVPAACVLRPVRSVKCFGCGILMRLLTRGGVCAPCSWGTRSTQTSRMTPCSPTCQ